LLPAEIRNKIYDLVLPERRVSIADNHPQKELWKWQNTHEILRGPYPRYHFRGEILTRDESESHRTNLNILLTTKQVSEEAQACLFGKTTFVFRTTRTFNKFLDFIPANCKTSITSIEVFKHCYGEVVWTKDTKWKRKADQDWSDCCDRIADELTSLKQFNLWLKIADWPVQLKPTADWAQPLLNIGAKRELERVNIILRHKMFAPARTDALARTLSDKMMTKLGREEREKEEAIEAVRELQRKEAELAKVKIEVSKKRQNVVIAIPAATIEADQKRQQQKKASAAGAGNLKAGVNLSKSKGLNEYYRVNLETMHIAFV
jgi:hypothetical protein